MSSDDARWHLTTLNELQNWCHPAAMKQVVRRPEKVTQNNVHNFSVRVKLQEKLILMSKNGAYAEWSQTIVTSNPASLALRLR